MEILLKEPVEHLGSTGQLVDVKAGYARNYLIPKGKAIYVTRKNRKSIEKEIGKYEVLEQKRLAGLRDYAEKVSNTNCTVAVKADENDRLYGSVTAEEIARSLAVAGIEVTPKAISIPKAIRSIGVFEVKLNLGSGVNADLKVWVVKE